MSPGTRRAWQLSAALMLVIALYPGAYVLARGQGWLVHYRMLNGRHIVRPSYQVADRDALALAFSPLCWCEARLRQRFATS
ncbi:MAG: hypothetical protein H0X45_00475 [Planctomycetes bacterium]|nr:hypothetical protein [Planctomycetota bacterium]